MNQVFSQCDQCKRDILVGEKRMTVTENTEKIEDESCVRPFKVDVIHAWCSSCALLPKGDKNKSSKLTFRRAIDEFFDIFFVRAALGCFLLSLIIIADGGIVKLSDFLLTRAADTAKLGPAPDGMINVLKCKYVPPSPHIQNPINVCAEKVIETLPLKEAINATASGSLSLLIYSFYLVGFLVGALMKLLQGALERHMTARIKRRTERHIISSRKSSGATK